MPDSIHVAFTPPADRFARWASSIAIVLVLVLLLIVVQAAHGQDPTGQPPPFPAGPQAHPVTSWLSPEGLNAIFGALLLLGTVAAFILRKFEKGALADKLDAAVKDGVALRGALTTTVAGVERFRKLSSPQVATELADEIRTRAEKDGTHGVLDAVVQAVTAPGASVPATPPPDAPHADPIIAAVRGATGRLDPSKRAA